jgi:hypothetical protein
MKEFTNTRGETILINMPHIILIEKMSEGSKITLDSKITAPGDYEQKNYIYVKESFEYIMYSLSDKPFDPDQRIPKRFN